MIPVAFEYLRVAAVDEALAALAEHGSDAKVIAGGHSLLPLMKLRLASPAVLVDVGRLRDLSYVRVDGDDVAIGALTRHADLAGSPLARAHVPILAHVAGLVGDPQVRVRGTIGGSLAHADPVADLPAAVLALDATLVVQGPGGIRTVAAGDFFRGYFETALEPEELLVEIRVRPCGDLGWGYQKFVRRANDWAIVAAAAVDGRVALAGMAPTPVRAGATERALASGASPAEAALLADDGTAPDADLHASEPYRRHLARLLTRRALEGRTSR